ncbi:MAG: hypothetical protein AB1758_04410 [Candidatus Eremiobacterota bacterium]
MPWLAHGADPTPLTWDEAVATLVLALGALGVLLGLGYRGIRPFLREGRRDVLAWGGVGLLLVMGVLWAFLSSALQQLRQPTRPEEFHAHTVNHGGQVAMWGDYHIEVGRDVSGEYRVWLSDAYRRPISARYYRGTVTPEPSGTAVPLEASLDASCAFARLPREVRTIVLDLDVPGHAMRFRFRFDETPGKRSRPEWCGPTPTP